MEENSVDAIVTDPPYGLEFMGKEWDGPKAWRDDANRRDKKREREMETGYSKKIYGSVDEKSPAFYNLSPKHLRDYQSWTTTWATQALRVLKPGGSMLCFGGTRTFHRLTCGVEDAGFIIKDCLMWLYGSGFPKAQSLDKMIDKRLGCEREVRGLYTDPDGCTRTNRTEGIWSSENPGSREITLPATDLARHWDGYKIGGIKPAWEPIIWAVKPPEGAWIDNVLKYGIGAVNVEECRVGVGSDDDYGRNPNRSDGSLNTWGHAKKGDTKFRRVIYEDGWTASKGRFPANLILSHSPSCVQVGVKRVKGSYLDHDCTDGNLYGHYETARKKGYADPDGLETVENWSCDPDCPVRLLDEQSGGIHGAGHVRDAIRDCEPTGLFGMPGDGQRYGDTGGASRFFYTSKATDRDSYNDHPTLKPTDIIEWLVRLVTRPGQLVLDPFAGSGTTGVAAVHSGRDYILIDQDEHYCEIAERRLSEVQMGMF